ncbi:MAG: hypothetical protein AB7C97_04075 [Oscillospiraceae bacterium]
MIKISRIISEFDKYISSCKPIDRLAVFHSTKLRHAEEILNTGLIIPQKIDNYDKESSFLFYGRASYPINGKGISDNYPVCFIFKPTIFDLDKVYPFDSGAFISGRYKGFVNEVEQLSDFQLEPDYDYVSRFINFFYTSKDKYRQGRYNVNNIDMLKFNDYLLNAYARIISCPTIDTDHRKNTIEFIVSEPIRIADHIIGIVMPKELEACDDLMDKINNTYKIKHSSYRTIFNANLVYYFSEIYELASSLAEELGL